MGDYGRERLPLVRWGNRGETKARRRGRLILLSTGNPMTDCRRIVLVLHDFSGGGSELVAIRLAGIWAAHRHVEIVAGSSAGPARERVAPGMKVHDLGMPRAPGSRRRLGHALANMVDAHDIVVGPGNFHIPVLAGLRRSPATVVCKLSNPKIGRASCRKECSVVCRSRWSPYH